MPHLEALMEAEEGQPHNDYRLAAQIAPPVCGLAGVFTCWLIFRGSPLAFGIGAGVSALIAATMWVIFDRADKSIPETRKRLRKQSKMLWQRYRGLKNLIGLEPTLAASVGDVLNSAAGIYLRHAKPVRYFAGRQPETSLSKCERAMEDAMARMLDLTIPETPAAQEVELSKGWALSLLKEMRALDSAMERQRQALEMEQEDPLVNLREARFELEYREQARVELES